AYVPRGPVPASAETLDWLAAWARNSGVARLVVEPQAPETFSEVLREKGFKQIAQIQPQHTRIVELMPPNELLATFRHGRRYNIRAGLKRGVIVEEGKDAAELAHQSAAVEAGCTDFDLWGVPPPDAGDDHRWHGIGIFKSEFGGEVVSYPGAWELVLSAAGATLIGIERKTRAYVRGLKRNNP